MSNNHQGQVNGAGEVLGESCLDDGKCHHSCTEQCFRRQCCEPLSGYKGPWKYEPASAGKADLDITIEGDSAKLLHTMLSPALEGDDEFSPVRLIVGGGHSGYGLYVASADYPGEGAELLAPVTRSDAAEKAEKAEKEAIRFAAEAAEWRLRAEAAEQRFDAANRMRNQVLEEIAALRSLVRAQGIEP